MSGSFAEGGAEAAEAAADRPNVTRDNAHLLLLLLLSIPRKIGDNESAKRQHMKLEMERKKKKRGLENEGERE